MGLFNQTGKVNAPNSTTHTGIVGGVIQCDMDRDVFAYKYPGGNDIKRGAVIIVRQNQVAALYINGVRQGEMLEPGRHVVTESNNFPFINNYLNVATGGESSYPAEVWFFNLTTESKVRIGFGKSANVFCQHTDSNSKEQTPMSIGGNGQIGIKLSDPAVFMDRYLGSGSMASSGEVLEFVQERLKSIFIDQLNEIIINENPDIKDLLLTRRKDFNRKLVIAINRELQAEYGIEATTNTVINIFSPDYEKYVEDLNASMREGAGVHSRRSHMGRFDGSEQQYDIIKTAAANEGVGSFSAIGIGMAMGSQFAQYANTMTPQGTMPSQATPPPIPSAAAIYFVLNGQQAGPYDINAIRQMVASGVITPQTLAWKNGMADWSPAIGLAELTTLFNVPPSVPGMPLVPPTV